MKNNSQEEESARSKIDEDFDAAIRRIHKKYFCVFIADMAFKIVFVVGMATLIWMVMK